MTGLSTQYAYHFRDKIEWKAENIITQNEINSFSTIGQGDKCSLKWYLRALNKGSYPFYGMREFLFIGWIINRLFTRGALLFKD